MAITLVYQKTRAKIGSVELDASLTEQHSAEVEVTEHPIERGANVADHARPKPEVVTIEGLISNTPLPAPTDVPLQQRAGDVAYLSASKLTPSAAGEAYQELLRLKDSGELLTVVTGIRTYESMMITALSVPRDARSGQALRFSATLKEVKVVNSQTVTVTVTDDKAKKKKDTGKKGTPETPAPTRLRSGMKAGYDNRENIKDAAKGFVKFLTGGG